MDHLMDFHKILRTVLILLDSFLSSSDGSQYNPYSSSSLQVRKTSCAMCAPFHLTTAGSVTLGFCVYIHIVLLHARWFIFRCFSTECGALISRWRSSSISRRSNGAQFPRSRSLQAQSQWSQSPLRIKRPNAGMCCLMTVKPLDENYGDL